MKHLIGYTLAVALAAGFWAWMGVATAVGLMRKRVARPDKSEVSA